MTKMLQLRYLLIGAVTLPLWELLADAFSTNFGLMLIVGIFVTVDAITGVYAAFRKKLSTSRIFFRMFFDKFVAYSAVMIISFSIFMLVHMQDYQMENAELIITYPMGVMIVREFWSIGENIEKIQPNFFNKIKNILNIWKK